MFEAFHLAFINPGAIGAMIPVVALMIPIVAILVRHQQRMAEIIHGSQHASGPLLAQIESLRKEVAELRQLVYQQTLALDGLTSQRERKPLAQDHDSEG